MIKIFLFILFSILNAFCLDNDLWETSSTISRITTATTTTSTQTIKTKASNFIDEDLYARDVNFLVSRDTYYLDIEALKSNPWIKKVNSAEDVYIGFYASCFTVLVCSVEQFPQRFNLFQEKAKRSNFLLSKTANGENNPGVQIVEAFKKNLLKIIKSKKNESNFLIKYVEMVSNSIHRLKNSKRINVYYLPVFNQKDNGEFDTKSCFGHMIMFSNEQHSILIAYFKDGTYGDFFSGENYKLEDLDLCKEQLFSVCEKNKNPLLKQKTSDETLSENNSSASILAAVTKESNNDIVAIEPVSSNSVASLNVQEDKVQLSAQDEDILTNTSSETFNKNSMNIIAKPTFSYYELFPSIFRGIFSFGQSCLGSISGVFQSFKINFFRRH